MKTKILLNSLLLIMAILLSVTGLQQCKNVGPTDMPEPDFKANNQIIIKSFDNENGTALMGWDLCITKPDGGIIKHYDVDNPFKINEPTIGIYKIIVTMEGYVKEEVNIIVDSITHGTDAETLILHDFYLNKTGESSMVSASGTTLSLKSTHQQNSTLDFPSGAFNNDQMLSVTFLQPSLRHGCIQIIGNRVVTEGYLITPHMVFQENHQPLLTIPLNNTNIIECAPFYYGIYDSINQQWEMIEGVMNETKTYVSFKIPHFSKGYLFGQLNLHFIRDEWSVPERFASGGCDEGVSGNFTYKSPYNPIIQQLNASGQIYIQKISSGRRFRGPKKDYKQELWGSCLRRIFSVYDHTGKYLGNIEVPWHIFKITVEATKCHDQGGG